MTLSALHPNIDRDPRNVRQVPLRDQCGQRGLEVYSERCAKRTGMGTREKSAIVLLPGMDGTGELLRTLSDQLSTHRPVQVIDYPLARPLNYDQLVLYVRERVPNDPFVILGESFSGPIAIEVAATDPQVIGLILASSFARHPLPTQFAAFARLLDLRWIPTSVFIAALMGLAAPPKLRVQFREVLARLPQEVIRGRVQDVLRVDKSRRLREIKCPLLCLHGRADRLVGKRHVDEIVAARPDCDVRWLDASHMLLATRAKAASTLIEEFCERLNCRGLAASV
jgi:pimeloyl-[acyl-carrier protein] methyl ester esterase